MLLNEAATPWETFISVLLHLRKGNMKNKVFFPNIILC